MPRLPGTPGGRIDLPGIALSAAGLVALTYGFIQLGDRGWTDGGSLALVVGGQLLCSVVLDHFGVLYKEHSLSAGRLAGVVLLAAGVVLVRSF